jgi:glutaredoxin
MIVIYGTETCSYCREAIEVCEKYQLDFQYKSIDNEYYNNRNEFKRLFPEARTVPQITWNERVIGGYTDLLQEIEDTIGDYGQGAF